MAQERETLQGCDKLKGKEAATLTIAVSSYRSALAMGWLQDGDREGREGLRMASRSLVEGILSAAIRMQVIQ